MSQFFASGGQNIGVSVSASVLPMNIQDWFPLGLTCWISLQSKRLSRFFSNTTVQNHQFFSTQLGKQRLNTGPPGKSPLLPFFPPPYLQHYRPSWNLYDLFLSSFSGLFSSHFPSLPFSVNPNCLPFLYPCLYTHISFLSLPWPPANPPLSFKTKPRGHLLWLSSAGSHRALGTVPSDSWPVALPQWMVCLPWGPGTLRSVMTDPRSLAGCLLAHSNTQLAFIICIYLAVPDFSGGMWGLSVAAFKLLVLACGI